MNKYVSDEEILRLLEINKDWTPTALAKKLGISYGRVKKVLLANHMILPTQIGAAIIEMHKDGYTRKEIAEKLNICMETVGIYTPRIRNVYTGDSKVTKWRKGKKEE